FMYLRFNATKDDAEKMFRDFGVTEPTIIGNGNGEKQMVSWNEYYELHKKSFDNNIEFDENHYVKESTLDWLPWWTPTKIKKGKAFRLNILPGKPIRDGGPTAAAPTGFGIYYDEDTGTIYFCWNYS
ncbi:hypothetical protein HY772_01365, partial [Candidatus Woesearchaeota archaeon]|nr:hypothetical protein [Candidatus Woesearchaeota archaeon]